MSMKTQLLVSFHQQHLKHRGSCPFSCFPSIYIYYLCCQPHWYYNEVQINLLLFKKKKKGSDHVTVRRFLKELQTVSIFVMMTMIPVASISSIKNDPTKTARPNQKPNQAGMAKRNMYGWCAAVGTASGKAVYVLVCLPCASQMSPMNVKHVLKISQREQLAAAGSDLGFKPLHTSH